MMIDTCRLWTWCIQWLHNICNKDELVELWRTNCKHTTTASVPSILPMMGNTLPHPPSIHQIHQQPSHLPNIPKLKHSSMHPALSRAPTPSLRCSFWSYPPSHITAYVLMFSSFWHMLIWLLAWVLLGYQLWGNFWIVQVLKGIILYYAWSKRCMF
jgi:hypothetical protein